MHIFHCDCSGQQIQQQNSKNNRLYKQSPAHRSILFFTKLHSRSMLFEAIILLALLYFCLSYFCLKQQPYQRPSLGFTNVLMQRFTQYSNASIQTQSDPKRDCPQVPKHVQLINSKPRQKQIDGNVLSSVRKCKQKQTVMRIKQYLYQQRIKWLKQKEQKEEKKLKNQCSICMQSNRVYFQLPCEHKFHKKCISGWFMKSESCPMCRRTYRKMDIMKIDDEDDD